MTRQKKVLSDYFFTLIAGFVAQIDALSSLEHALTKGELREVFVEALLKKFLPNHLSVGTGIIINNKTAQSKQTDIVVYDNRILPPFLTGTQLNVFPIESIISTIEVKSNLGFGALKKAEKDAEHLLKKVFKEHDWLGETPKYAPLCVLLGFEGTRIRKIASGDAEWITKNILYLKMICSVGKFSWVKIKEGNKSFWKYGAADEQYREIKRFVAILIDNIRTLANLTWATNLERHKDWLGQYIRDT